MTKERALYHKYRYYGVMFFLFFENVLRYQDGEDIITLL